LTFISTRWGLAAIPRDAAMSNPSPAEILYAQSLSDLIASSMVTYLLIEDNIGNWRDWLRAKILATDDNTDPDAKAIFQVMANAPDDVIESAIHSFIHDRREEARNRRFITKGLHFNG
jgi:hypothetical protein